MYVNEIKNALPALFAAKVVPFFWGVHGIGKTTEIKRYADEAGHALFTLALGNVEIPDLLGILDRDATGTASRYLIPEPFQQLITFANETPDKYAIVFLDELNHARKDCLSPIFQMVLENSLHATKFPANFRFVVASNPPTEDYAGVLQLRNQALLDRFCHIKVEPSSRSWLEWAGSKPSEVVDFIRDNPTSLRATGAAFSVDTFCKPSERSWAAAQRLMDNGASKELIYGMVGIAEATNFYTWQDQNRAKMITGEDIMNYSKETQKKVKKLVKDGKWAEVQKCVANLAEEARKRTHELHELYKEGKDPTDGKSPKDITDNVVRFLEDLPDEVFMSAFQSIGENIECRYLAYSVFGHKTNLARIKRISPESL